MSGGTFPAADCAERRCRLLRRCRSRMRRHRQTVRNRRTGRSVLCRRDRNFAPRRLPCFRPGGGYRSSFSRPEHPFAGCGRNGGGSPAWCGFNGSRLFRKFFYALKIACPGNSRMTVEMKRLSGIRQTASFSASGACGTGYPPCGPHRQRLVILRTKSSYSVLSDVISSRTLWIFSARHAFAPQKA